MGRRVYVYEKIWGINQTPESCCFCHGHLEYGCFSRIRFTKTDDIVVQGCRCPSCDCFFSTEINQIQRALESHPGSKYTLEMVRYNKGSHPNHLHSSPKIVDPNPPSADLPQAHVAAPSIFMDVNSKNLVSLQGEDISLELQGKDISPDTEALLDERKNAQENYAHFNQECASLQKRIPYQNVGQYATGIDYEDIESIQYKKSQNLPLHKKLETLRSYCNASSLYSGHLLLLNGNHYFFTDSPALRSFQTWRKNGATINFVHSDDEGFREYWKKWRFPKKGSSISFSRSITMKNKRVEDVSVRYDAGNSDYSSITDNYLRNALKRNKGKDGIQSIIQTIQEKQDDIRALPLDTAFIVQGCAGSGKTMVLLHRLRYQLYNRHLKGDDYIFLVPSNTFTRYIHPIATEFKIRYRNIFSYQRYYQSLLGLTTNANDPDLSELVFPQEYLQRVYSGKFLQECYLEFLCTFAQQYEALGTYAESAIVHLQNHQRDSLELVLSTGKMRTLSSARHLAEPLLLVVDSPLEKYEDIPGFCDNLDNLLTIEKEKASAIKDADVCPDDPRVLSDTMLQNLTAKVEAQEERVKNAPSFTLSSHKKKLAQLVETRDKYRDELIQELKKADELAAQSLLFNNPELKGLSLKDASGILQNIRAAYTDIQDSVTQVADELLHFDELFSKRYSEEITALQQIIESSFDQHIVGLASHLDPLSAEIKAALSLGTKLYSSLAELLDDDFETDCHCKIFTRRSERDMYAYVNTLLFNICRKKIKAETGIKLCNKYKHYWFLALYSKYLTGGKIRAGRHYIFIDEAQDLSPAEISLIYKLNNQGTANDTPENTSPVMNIFGDVNQAITLHGVHQWSDLPFDLPVYELAENFRNTNQIIEFCNATLPFHMQDVGVDMEDVRIFDNLTAASQVRLTDATFIVKNPETADDLKAELKKYNIRNVVVHTVKEIKGMEFKDVIVVDRDMSDNEKYIAYTRALANLTVIHNLPTHVDQRRTYIIQGEDIETEE